MNINSYAYPDEKEYEIKHQERPTYTLLKKIVKNTNKISDKEKLVIQYFLEKGKYNKKYEFSLKSNKQSNNTIEGRLKLRKGEIISIYKSLEDKKLINKYSYNEDDCRAPTFIKQIQYNDASSGTIQRK